MATYATDRSFQEAQHDDVPFLAASSYSESLLELSKETPVLSPTSVTPPNSVVYPESICPFGRLEAIRKDSKKRKKKKLEIYPDTPVKERIEEETNSKSKGKITPSKKQMNFQN